MFYVLLQYIILLFIITNMKVAYKVFRFTNCPIVVGIVPLSWRPFLFLFYYYFILKQKTKTKTKTKTIIKIIKKKQTNISRLIIVVLSTLQVIPIWPQRL